MPSKGDLRWEEVITVNGDKITERKKVLQIYCRNDWGYLGWENVPTNQVIFDRTESDCKEGFDL